MKLVYYLNNNIDIQLELWYCLFIGGDLMASQKGDNINWGGARKGAGRPIGEKKQYNYRLTDLENERLKIVLNYIRRARRTMLNVIDYFGKSHRNICKYNDCITEYATCIEFFDNNELNKLDILMKVSKKEKEKEKIHVSKEEDIEKLYYFLEKKYKEHIEDIKKDGEQLETNYLC